LPRTTREIGAWIARQCGIEYQGRSGLIALLHRLGMEHRMPKAISRKLDPAKQAVFIKAYDALLNQLAADEAVVFADAVHPTHAVRPVGCWAPKDTAVACGAHLRAGIFRGYVVDRGDDGGDARVWSFRAVCCGDS
jgi:hypothetical protein